MHNPLIKLGEYVKCLDLSGAAAFGRRTESAGFLHDEAGHSCGLCRQNPRLPCEGRKLDSRTPGHLPASRFSYRRSTGSDAVVSVVAKPQGGSRGDLQSRNGCQSPQPVGHYAVKTAANGSKTVPPQQSSARNSGASPGGPRQGRFSGDAWGPSNASAAHDRGSSQDRPRGSRAAPEGYRRRASAWTVRP